jgi:hypothetical protein
MDGGRIDYTLGFEADTAAIKAAADEMMRNKATWDDAPAAVNKLDEAEKKQNKTTLDLTKNKGDLKKALLMVSGASAEAGVAAGFLMGRMAGLIGVGMYLINQTKAGIESLMNSIATPVWEGFIGIVQKQRRAWQEAAQAAGLYDREIRRAENAQDSRAETVGRMQEVITARLRGEDAILEKRKANEIAAVNDSVMRAEEKASRIAGIERKFAEQKVARELQAAAQAQAVAQLKTGLDMQELEGLQDIRGALRAEGQKLGTADTIKAKEDATRKRLADEDAAEAAREVRRAELERKLAAMPYKPWTQIDLPTTLMELGQIKTQSEASSGIRAGLRQEIAQQGRVNPGKLRSIAEYDQAIGLVEGDIKSTAGSINAARRGERTSEMVSLLGVNASAAVAGAPQTDLVKFQELSFRELQRIAANTEKLFSRQ